MKFSVDKYSNLLSVYRDRFFSYSMIQKSIKGYKNNDPLQSIKYFRSACKSSVDTIIKKVWS